MEKTDTKRKKKTNQFFSKESHRFWLFLRLIHTVLHSYFPYFNLLYGFNGMAHLQSNWIYEQKLV